MAVQNAILGLQSLGQAAEKRRAIKGAVEAGTELLDTTLGKTDIGEFAAKSMQKGVLEPSQAINILQNMSGERLAMMLNEKAMAAQDPTQRAELMQLATKAMDGLNLKNYYDNYFGTKGQLKAKQEFGELQSQNRSGGSGESSQSKFLEEIGKQYEKKPFSAQSLVGPIQRQLEKYAKDYGLGDLKDSSRTGKDGEEISEDKPMASIIMNAVMSPGNKITVDGAKAVTEDFKLFIKNAIKKADPAFNTPEAAIQLENLSQKIMQSVWENGLDKGLFNVERDPMNNVVSKKARVFDISMPKVSEMFPGRGSYEETGAVRKTKTPLLKGNKMEDSVISRASELGIKVKKIGE